MKAFFWCAVLVLCVLFAQYAFVCLALYLLGMHKTPIEKRATLKQEDIDFINSLSRTL